MKKFGFAIIVGVIALAVFFRGPSASGLKYAGGFRDALKEARSDEKPVLLNFGGPW